MHISVSHEMLSSLLICTPNGTFQERKAGCQGSNQQGRSNFGVPGCFKIWMAFFKEK